jgi:hypothetical protein
MDVFAALLGNAGGDETSGVEITQSSSAIINGIELKGIAGEIIASLLEGSPAGATEGSDPAPAAGEEGGGALTGLADLLLKIEAALDAGEPVAPELMTKLNDAVDALAVIIGGPVSVDTAVTAELPVEIDATASAKLSAPDAQSDPAEPVHPMLKGLADKLAEIGGRLGDADGELAQKLVLLAEKLGTVRTTIAELLEAAPELKTAIGELMKLKGDTKVAATASIPALAVPELKLPANASLSVKKVEGQGASPPPDEVDAPADTEVVADIPKLQVKADVKVEVKADQPITANATEKRDAPALPAPSQVQAGPPADTTLTPATATTAIGASGTVHGEVRAVHSAYQAPSPINLPQVAFEIVRQVQQGVSKFQIRLDPPELGRVDVNLDMDKSGQVNAKLIVERSETLDLLQRDQRALERALAQAGLDTSKTNLEFSLKQNPFAGQDGKGQDQPGSSPFTSDVRTPVLAEAEPQAVTVYRGSASPGGLNIFV